MKPLAKLSSLIAISFFLETVLFLTLALSTQADTIAITNNSDSGAGSLRQALLNANVGDTITFDPIAFPPTNPATITLFSPLPDITIDGLTIDGSGAGVILDGGSAGDTNGLLIDADGVTIRYLQILNFAKDGIDVDPGAENTTMEGNVIGGNGHHGIRVQGGGISGTRILNNWWRTEVSGTVANGDHGITIWGPATGTLVISNSIGTDASGSLDLGNNLNGIIIRFGAQGNTVGPGNTITYNGRDGVRVEGATTLHNTLTQNSITANDELGINNVDGGNSELAPPTLLTVTGTTIEGMTGPGATVELFSDPFFEGQRFVVSTTADVSGTFVVATATPLTIPLLTATSTDAAGNTSKFSAFCRLGPESPSVIWPYCDKVPSPISSPFGPRQMASQGYRYDFHRGVDLPAPLWTPFVAIAEGVVTTVVTDPIDLDGTIRIRHTDPVTYYSHYRHVAQPFVTVGQVVSKGTLIGSTGKSASGFAHTHFEIRDEPGGYEKYTVNPFGRMPYQATDDYEIEIIQVSVDPTDPTGSTTVLVAVTGSRQELDLNRVTVSVDGSERVLDFNALNRTRTPAPNNTNPDVLDNPCQDNICIMPARFNTSSDVYRLDLAFHHMSGNPPYTVTVQATDLFSHTVTAETTLIGSEWLLTPVVVTATTPTDRWVTHTHKLTNVGLTTQAYTLTAKSAQSWFVALEPATVTLTPGGSMTFTSSISVPNDGYIVTGTMDCVVVEILSRTRLSAEIVYLPLISKH